VAYDYIDIYAKEIFKGTEFLSSSHDTILSFVRRNTLNIGEVDLFENVMAWAKAELKRNNTTESPDALKRVLGDILMEIRFPTMYVTATHSTAVHHLLLLLSSYVLNSTNSILTNRSTQDIAVKVNVTKMLEPQQVLELFTYLGMVNAGNKDAKLGASLAKFNREKRKGRQPPAWFKWDSTKRHAK
jgi:hypothetical protein